MTASPMKQMELGQFIKTIDGHSQRVQCMELVPGEDKATVWSGSANGVILVHAAKTGEQIGKLQAPGRGQDEDYICCLLYVNGHVWCGSSDGTINVFSAQTGKCLTQLLGHTGAVNCLVASEYYIWSGAGDKTLRAWDPENGKSKKILTGHTNWVRAIVVIDGKVWSGSDDCSIRVWDEQTGQLLQDLRGHGGGVVSLLLVGRQVWSGSADKTIKIWDAQSYRQLKDIHGHNGWVTSLLYASGHVWSGSSDKTIRIWNVKNGNCMKVLQGHNGWVWCMLAVGFQVWSGSGDKSIRCWMCEDPVPMKYDLSPVRQPAPRPRSPVAANAPPSPQVSPIKRTVLNTPTIVVQSENDAVSPHSTKQLEFLHRQNLAENEELARRLQQQQSDLEQFKHLHREESERLREQYQRQLDKTSQLEQVRSLLSKKVEDLQDALQEADEIARSKGELHQQLWKIKTELEDVKKELEHEKLVKEALAAAQRQLDLELKAIRRTVQDDLQQTADTQTSNLLLESFRRQDDFENFEEWKRNYDKQLSLLTSQLLSETHKRLASMELEMELDEMAARAPEDLVKDAKATRGELEFDINIHKRKFKFEAQARVQLEGLAERLQEELRRKGKSDPSYPTQDRISQLERQLVAEKNKNSSLEKQLQAAEAFDSQDPQQQNKKLFEMLKTQVKETEKRLEMEVQQAKDNQTRTHEKEKARLQQEIDRLKSLLEDEMERRVDLEGKMNQLYYKVERENDVLSQEERKQIEFQHRLEYMQQELNDALGAKKALMDENLNLQHRLQDARKKLQQKENESDNANKKLQIESATAEDLQHKLDASVQDWKVALDLLRRSDVKSLEALESIIRTNANADLEESRLNAQVQIHKNHHDLKRLEEELAEAQGRIASLEESNQELLKKIDEIAEGGTDTNSLVSELFQAKKEAEDKLEDVKKKLKAESKTRTGLEDSNRKLQLRVEKLKRDLESETKSAQTVRKKLEDELVDWKTQMEKELEKSIKRLEEEDLAKRELEEQNMRLQQEISDLKRQVKLVQTEYKSKLDVESDDKRTLADTCRRLQAELEDTKKALIAEERARIEEGRQREMEIKEWKQLVEQELADSVKKVAEAELKRTESDELNRKLQGEIDQIKMDWQDEADELRRKLDMESKSRMNLEAAKRDLHEQIEECKKNLRTESNLASELKDQARMLQKELDDSKRAMDKLNELKKDVESKNRKIAELAEANRSIQQQQQEEQQKFEKKCDMLKMKLDMESKLKEDLGELKKRLEKELEESEKTFEEEVNRRKQFEEDNWKLQLELNEANRKLEEVTEEFQKKLAAEAMVRTVLQESNDKLHGDLENTRSDADKKLRTRQELEDLNKRLSQDLDSLKATFEEKFDTLHHDLQTERARRIEAEESVERAQQECNKLKDALDEVKARQSLEASKRQFERELELKKRSIERQLDTRRKGASFLDDSDSSFLNQTQNPQESVFSVPSNTSFSRSVPLTKEDLQPRPGSKSANTSTISDQKPPKPTTSTPGKSSLKTPPTETQMKIQDFAKMKQELELTEQILDHRNSTKKKVDWHDLSSRSDPIPEKIRDVENSNNKYHATVQSFKKRLEKDREQQQSRGQRSFVPPSMDGSMSDTSVSSLEGSGRPRVDWTEYDMEMQRELRRTLKKMEELQKGN